jgi:lipopolysaccharide export system permease protein
MYILTRYVVWEVLKYFFSALACLTLMITLGMGVKKAGELGLPPLLMLKVIPFMLPEMLGITIPVAMLYSVSSVYGRMTGSNEVVALKSLGINPMAVVWPVLVLAAFLSLGTVWMYEIAATKCKISIARIGCESIEDIAYSALQKNRAFDNDQISINVKRVEGKKLMGPTIVFKGPNITIRAAEAEIHTDLKTRELKILYRDGSVDLDGRIGFSSAEEEFVLPLPEPIPQRYHRDWVAMRDIPDLVVELRTRLRDYIKIRDAQKALGAPESPDDVKNIEDQRLLIDRLRTEPFRRWANGFTCLCFALIGTPVAMLWRHADVLTNFFVCFLPILSVYYPLLMFCDSLTTSGTMPPIFFWTSNVVLSIPAIVLLRWVIRH